MSVRIPPHPPPALRGELRIKRAVERTLHRTGLWNALDWAFAHGRRIEITRHRVAAPLAEPVTVALIADLHLWRIGAVETRMLQLLRTTQPDAIVIAGDLCSFTGRDSTYLRVLSELSAPRGVWMVAGNWDYWAPMSDAQAVLERAGVRGLTNEAAEIAPGLWLAGLDDAISGVRDPEAAFRCVPPGAWVLAAIHCPVSFDDVAGRCALALAGHTHGGQIRVPGLPPLWLPAGCGPYVSGWYERNGSRMYVSRGLAAHGLPVRLFCRPEIALFTIGRLPPG